MRALLNDLRYGARSLRKRPGVTIMAILSLGIGIGITTTAFSLLNGMALRTQPGIRAQDRLVTLGLTVAADGGGTVTSSTLLSWPDVEVLRSRGELFQGVAAAGYTEVALAAGGEPVVEEAEVVSGNYFRLLGSRPERGRFLDESDVQSGAATAVLAYRVFETLGAPDIVGRRVELNGAPFTVVGVAPPAYTGMVPGDVLEPDRPGPGVWVSLGQASLVRPRWVEAEPLAPEARWLRVVARLDDGVDRARLEAGLPLAARALEEALPGQRPGAGLVYGDLTFGPGAGAWRPVLTIAAFLVVPILVLLIACANAANLLLARATERRRELGVRAALGAGRGALVRQVLAESLLLAVGAGVLGLVVAEWSRSIAALYAVHLTMDAPVDLRVFAFTFVIAVLAGILLGLIPALRASRPDLAVVLAGPSRTTDGRGTARLRRGLVVAQVALSMLLLVAGGLFIRSARHGLTVETGLEEDGLVLVTLDLDVLRYDEPAGRAFYQRLTSAVRALPEVAAAAVADLPPLDGLPWGRVAPMDGDVGHGIGAGFAYTGDHWFETAGVPLVAGRAPRADGAGDEAAITRALAASLWPGGDVLGRRLRIGTGEGARVVTVVGVVGNVRARLYETAAPVVYRPRGNDYVARATLYVRGGRPGTVVPAVRAVIRRLDPRLPVHTVESAAQLRARRLLPWRLMASALGTLGAIGLLLAVAGLYGVTAFSVARRTREIGIRIALGAGRADVLGMVLRESLLLVTVGLGVGAGLAALVASLLRSMLFGVSPLDPVTYGVLAAGLLAVGALAALVPGRRAASVEPVRVLSE